MFFLCSFSFSKTRKDKKIPKKHCNFVLLSQHRRFDFLWQRITYFQRKNVLRIYVVFFCWRKIEIFFNMISLFSMRAYVASIPPWDVYFSCVVPSDTLLHHSPQPSGLQLPKSIIWVAEAERRTLPNGRMGPRRGPSSGAAGTLGAVPPTLAAPHPRHPAAVDGDPRPLVHLPTARPRPRQTPPIQAYLVSGWGMGAWGQIVGHALR